MPNQDQLLARAVWKYRVTFQYMAQIVGVRVDGERIRIQRQRESIGDDEIRIARRNIQRAVVFQLNQNRRVFRRFIGEVKSDGRLHFLRLAHGHHVRVQHQIVSRIQPPRKSVRLNPRRAARFPEKEVAIEVENIAHNFHVHSGKTGTGF